MKLKKWHHACVKELKKMKDNANQKLYQNRKRLKVKCEKLEMEFKDNFVRYKEL